MKISTLYFDYFSLYMLFACVSYQLALACAWVNVFESSRQIAREHDSTVFGLFLFVQLRLLIIMTL